MHADMVETILSGGACTEYNDSDTNADVEIEITCGDTEKVVIEDVSWCYDSTPTGARISVQQDTGGGYSEIWGIAAVTYGEHSWSRRKPIVGELGASLKVVASAGGAGITCDLNVSAR